MTSPHSRGFHGARPVSISAGNRTEPKERPASPMMRKYEVTSLASNGDIRNSHHIAPATMLFEDAASAFARGALIQTTMGPVAIEDLLPGDEVITADGGAQKVLWIGSTMMVPTAPNQAEHMTRLTRIMADSLGIGRPMPDVMVGPAARLLKEKQAYRAMTGSSHLFIPVTDFVDGMGLISITPPSPVRMYHFALERHAAVKVAGLDMESYHPGANFADNIGRNMLSLFLSIFPHIHEPQDFGPLMHPRATLDILDNMNAA